MGRYSIAPRQLAEKSLYLVRRGGVSRLRWKTCHVVHGAPPPGGHAATSDPEGHPARMNLWEMLTTGGTPKHEGVHVWCSGAHVWQGL